MNVSSTQKQPAARIGVHVARALGVVLVAGTAAFAIGCDDSLRNRVPKVLPIELPVEQLSVDAGSVGPGLSGPPLSATFRDSCAPWDGAALAVRIAPAGEASCTAAGAKDTRGIFVSLWRSALHPVSGSTIPLGGAAGAESLGEAMECAPPHPCERLTDALLLIDGASPELLSGMLMGKNAQGQAVRLRFRAKRCPGSSLCG